MRGNKTARDGDGNEMEATEPHRTRHGNGMRQASTATTAEQPAAGSYPLPVPRQERRGGRRGGHDQQARWATGGGEDKASRRAVGDWLRGERWAGMETGAEA